MLSAFVFCVAVITLLSSVKQMKSSPLGRLSQAHNSLPERIVNCEFGKIIPLAAGLFAFVIPVDLLRLALI
ncbi:MAG: hypothetical protein H0X63_10230 [Flavobacteriales bacterium]|nr:hypothetical protein [Flavobacteriales bacterium]